MPSKLKRTRSSYGAGESPCLNDMHSSAPKKVKTDPTELVDAHKETKKPKLTSLERAELSLQRAMEKDRVKQLKAEEKKQKAAQRAIDKEARKAEKAALKVINDKIRADNKARKKAEREEKKRLDAVDRSIVAAQKAAAAAAAKEIKDAEDHDRFIVEYDLEVIDDEMEDIDVNNNLEETMGARLQLHESCNFDIEVVKFRKKLEKDVHEYSIDQDLLNCPSKSRNFPGATFGDILTKFPQEFLVLVESHKSRRANALAIKPIDLVIENIFKNQ